jgi:hypothetical protein
VSLLGPLLDGSGRLAEDLRARLTAEGVLFLAEELPGSVALHQRANGRPARTQFGGTSGAIAVTRRRVLVLSEGRVQIDLPVRDGRLRSIEVAADRSDRVLFAFELERLHADRRGRIEIRLRTAQAEQLVALVDAAR